MDTLDQIDSFMNAIIGQESGGNYDITNAHSGAYGAFQIMPENWIPWLEEAGLPITSPKTPENQYIVARAKMTALFNHYGSWRDVAIAWYHGTNGWELKNQALMDVPFNDAGNFDVNGQYPSLNSYGNSVYSAFQKIVGSNTSTPTTNTTEKTFLQNLKERITKPYDFEKTIPQAKQDAQSTTTQIKDFVTKGSKVVGQVLVGIVFMVLGIYLLTKDNTMILQKEGE